MLACATGLQIVAAVPPLAMNVDIRNWKTPMYGPLGFTEFQWKCDSQLAVRSIQETLTPQCVAAAVISATTCAWLTERPLGMMNPGRETRARFGARSEEHTSELQSHVNLVCRLLLEK